MLGLRAVAAQLPWAGLQTPLLVPWDFCGAWVWCWVSCRPLAAAPRDSWGQWWWLQHFVGWILQDFGLLLDFRWNIFLLCGQVSQVALSLFCLGLIHVSIYPSIHPSISFSLSLYIYMFLILLYLKVLLAQGTASCAAPTAILQFAALVRGLGKWWQAIALCMKDSRLYETDISL